MVFSSAAENDERDGNSCYASTTSQTEKGTVFLFDVEDDGLLLQVVSARASMPAGLGMCATILRLTLPSLDSAWAQPACLGTHQPCFSMAQNLFISPTKSEHAPPLPANK